MSDDDLIRRGDALAVVTNGKTTWGEAVTAIAALPAVTVGVKDFDIEVVRGNTGGNLSLYFNDHRVAGSKPWGGGTTIHKFRVQGDDAKSSGILATIRDFQTVPPVKECLTTDTALPAVTVPDLSDPVTVHANMLRGTIAKPTVEQIIHLYGVDALVKALTSIEYERKVAQMKEDFPNGI